MTHTKRLVAVVGALAAVLSALPAAALTLTPNPVYVGDFDHGTYYEWGINMAPDPDLQIISATITISNIYDVALDDYNVLSVYLLDDPAVNPLGAGGTPSSRVTSGWEHYGEDVFDGEELLFTYTDTHSWWNPWFWWYVPPTGDTVTYTLSADELALLNAYWQEDGTFGFGFDPDCHYSQRQVSFTCDFGPVTHPPVPEPASLSLLGIGLAGLALHRRYLK